MMYNLLPESAQGKVAREYHFRFLALLCSFFCAVFFIGTVLLLPSFVYVVSKKTEANAEIDSITQKDDASGSNSAISAKSVEEKIKMLSIFGEEKDEPHVFFNKILEEKGNSISLQRFSYSLDDKKALVINLEGVAKGRDDLTAFQNRLKHKAPFTSADFPVELLAKDSNIRFSMTVK